MVKILTIHICVVVVLAVLRVFGGQQYVSLKGSLIPRPESDMVVPINANHGRTVYIGHAQNKIICVGNATALGLVGASLVALLLWPLKKKRKRAF